MKISILRDRDKYRVRCTDDQGNRTSTIVPNMTEARQEVRRLRRQNQHAGITIEKALQLYRQHHESKGNRPRTIDTAIERVKAVFDTESTDLSQTVLSKLWEAFSKGKGGRSVAYRLGALKESRRFLRWLKGQKHIGQTVSLDAVTVLGRVGRGKPQLTEDQSRKFLAVALKRSGSGDEGAVAAATCLLLGLRASEVSDRIVSDLDAAGTKLLITSSKTAAGIRTMRIPEILQPHLARQAREKPHHDRIFGNVNRHWVLRAVHRICKLAGVPKVPAHGLRGTHARLAVAAGLSGELVAASLGHESFNVTRDHYAGSEAVEQAAAERAVRSLS